MGERVEVWCQSTDGKEGRWSRTWHRRGKDDGRWMGERRLDQLEESWVWRETEMLLEKSKNQMDQDAEQTVIVVREQQIEENMVKMCRWLSRQSVSRREADSMTALRAWPSNAHVAINRKNVQLFATTRVAVSVKKAHWQPDCTLFLAFCVHTWTRLSPTFTTTSTPKPPAATCASHLMHNLSITTELKCSTTHVPTQPLLWSILECLHYHLVCTWRNTTRDEQQRQKQEKQTVSI